MMKISGRLRHTSTHSPATLLRIRRVETRSRASTRPIASESTIATNAIWMLIQNPRSRNQKLFPEKSHSQLSGSKR